MKNKQKQKRKNPQPQEQITPAQPNNITNATEGMRTVLNGNHTTAAQANVLPYSPQFITHPATQNKTKSDGSVVNINPENAEFARNTVDENKK